MLTRRGMLQTLLGALALVAGGRWAGRLPANAPRPLVLVGIGGAGCNVLAQCGWVADAGIPLLAVDRDTQHQPPGAAFVDGADPDAVARQILGQGQRLLLVFADGGSASPSSRTGSRIGRAVLAAAQRANQLAGAVIITPFAWEGGAGVSPAVHDRFAATQRPGAPVAIVDNAALIDHMPGHTTLAAAIERINQVVARRLAQLVITSV